MYAVLRSHGEKHGRKRVVARLICVVGLAGVTTTRRDKETRPPPAPMLARLAEETRHHGPDIDAAVRNTLVWREKEDLLASGPGIGKTIALTRSAKLAKSSQREIATFAGLVP